MSAVKGRFSPDDVLDLYHRTTPDGAWAIRATGRWRSLEAGEPVYFSTSRAGQATSYGDAVVHVRIPAHLAELDDEFPDGEQHYRVPAAVLRLEHLVVTLSLEVDNVYADETVSLEHVDVTVPEPREDVDEWAREYLFEFTGTGRVKGEAGYFVKVTACADRPDLVGREFEWFG